MEQRAYRREKRDPAPVAAKVAPRSSVFLAVAGRYQRPVRSGMTAIKAPTGRHPHIANQYRPHPQIIDLAAETLNKPDQIRVTEIATLIGTHHLIMFGLCRQRVSADDTAIRKTAYRLCATRHRLGYFLPRRRCQAGATGKQGQQRNRGFVHFLPAWNISLHIGILRPLP